MGVPLQHVNLYRLKAALIKCKIIIFQHGHFPTCPSYGNFLGSYNITALHELAIERIFLL